MTCVGPPAYYSEKYSPVAHAALPRSMPGAIMPVRQTEPHTCGFCVISSVYRAYGLDPDAQRLRFCLGTDKQLVNLVEDTVGTIPPDMLRVLEQDGFEPTLELPREDFAARVQGHLSTGHPALALIKPKGWHWVVLAPGEGARVTVVDSLHESPYERTSPNWLHADVHAAILVSPDSPRDGP